MNDTNTGSHKKIGIVLGIAVVVAVAMATWFAERKPTDSQSAMSEAPASSPTDVPREKPAVKVVMQTPPADVPKQSASAYKDGTYSATGSYMSPGGEDQIKVTLSLANDIITAVSVTPVAGDGTSARYENRFISGYKQYVIGKNIADVRLTYISGSSLTPIGFNDALSQIKAEAKA